MALHLITGGGGFIGSNMVRFLLDKGIEVRVLDNFETGKRENLEDVSSKIELIEGDIRDYETCKRAADSAEVIYHLAALGSVPRSMEDPVTSHDVNVNGTVNMLEAARFCESGRFVFASSSSVYGPSEVLPQHEGLLRCPISPYAATKATGEMYCCGYYNAYGLETVCLRYFNVFGPRQDPTSQYAAAIPLFVSALMGDKSPTIFDDGEQSRGFTYVDNVTDANYKAGTCENPMGQAVNISTANAVTVNNVVSKIQELLGKEHVDSVYLPPRPGDIKHSLADVTKAKEVIGYEPFVTFEEGITRAIEWYKKNL